MIQSQIFDTLRQGREKKNTKKLNLAGFARLQEYNIRSALRQLAQALWPDQHWLGFIPIHDYRIRHQVDHQGYVWWVEHDIPPFDRYRCVTYRVILTLNDQQKPIWFVQSGSKSYEFSDPGSVSFERALALAAQDPPLIIPRRMGPALD